MANPYTDAQAQQIVNAPAVCYLRAYNDTGAYTKSVFTNSFNYSVTPEQFTQAFDDTGDVFDAIATETAEMTFDTGLIFDLTYLELMSGGLYTKSTVTGGATACQDQVIEGTWVDKKPNVINLLESPSETVYLVADGEPAITSVTGSIAGLLVVNDDYTIIPEVNSKSGYAIILNIAGISGLVVTEDVTIVYNAPVVVAQTVITTGGIKNYTPLEGYILTTNRATENVRIDFYKAYWNANFVPAFGAENSPEAAVSNFVFSIKLDGTGASGDQLFKITVG